MFRTAELGRTVSKDEFERLADPLRIELLDLQQKLLSADFPVIVLFAGVDKAGKGESINLITEWLDPRWIVTRAYGPPSDEERERPEFWRYWRDLPAKGRVGLFLSSWYSRPFMEQATGALDLPAFDEALERVTAFERTLADDGALILKFWMHLGKDAQRKRLKALEKDPLQSWRVTPTDWEHWHRYESFIHAAERLIQRTSILPAQWHIVEGLDERYRSVTVLKALRDSIRRHLSQRAAVKAVATMPGVDVDEAADSAAALASGNPPDQNISEQVDAALLKLEAGLPSVLQTLDMSLDLSKKDYERDLAIEQGRLALLARRARLAGVSTVLVFEGWDAAGKGGAIRRLTRALDARNFQVVPVAAPTDEEDAQHYLWRFWRHISRSGRFTIFDRSWYGRVLVERVEGYATHSEWHRAYTEIRDFEEQLIDHGMVVCKFWLHITPEEQFARFQAREAIAFKRWKLTAEDWRNREKWAIYEEAVNEMVEQTSTSLLPWTLVEANHKRYARVKILRTVCEALEKRLGKEKDKDKDKDKDKSGHH
ncbi:polyphosphate kinase [Rhodospirillum rubrum]|uniref:polyphosphate kinase n=1 Tax=Rhodospirillum rubrum TaxID=1085 RepID=UPI001907EA24|nr:polyphosphate kinase [Rhodospirillum rubrum]MBK1665851.1 polyphosphate kinase [Rhodospirillum rubrum]MBK1677889.1 polyphosphate kinase [Rhodospirillum rubrum]